MSDLVLNFGGDLPVEAYRTKPPLHDPRVLEAGELRRLGLRGALRRLRRERVRRCVTLVGELRTPSRWLAIVLLTLLAPAEHRCIVDPAGRRTEPSWLGLLSRELPFVLRRARVSRRVRRGIGRRLAALPPVPVASAAVPRNVVFFRPDLGPALTAGGSLAHIEGVVSGFIAGRCELELISPAPVAAVEARGARLTVVPADERYALSVELPHLAYNATVLPRLLERLRERPADLLYQRHALGCLAGAEASRLTGVPLVLEYNGPEVWIARHWGAARKHLELFETIERRVLLAASVVVAVSSALRDPLLEAGVPADRILINPNGVDADRFDPSAHRDDRRRRRERLGAGDEELVAGFVGTFGPWHGAEVLARAICGLPEEVVSRLRFVFIGDGPRRPSCEAMLVAAGRSDRTVFTGLIPFEQTPSWLAACDFFLSPHVPNADGSPFFGSPTKLFEYLAAGRAVIASELGQIGELLEHGRTAWLVPPGDPDALASAVVRLADDPELRRRLGEAGRQEARTRYTWTAHVERILESLARSADHQRVLP